MNSLYSNDIATSTDPPVSPTGNPSRRICPTTGVHSKLAFTTQPTDKPVKVCYVGCPGFPTGFAEIERIKMISKAINKSGVDVTVLSRKGILAPQENISFASKGVFEGIPYVISSGTSYRPTGFFRRKLLKVKGFLNEMRFLRRWANDHTLKCLMISTKDFADLLFYVTLAKAFKITTILNSDELASSMTVRVTPFLRLNDYLFEKMGYRMVDGALPISQFLFEFIGKVAPETPKLKIPVLCDMEKFQMEIAPDESDYFLFCGAAGYLEVISFVLSAFDLVHSEKEISLVLICHGNPEEMNSLHTEIRKMKKQTLVKIYTRLPYDKLVGLYKGAIALLIPLRPSIQDKARFPHKIGEYAASGRPIITTANGEVPYYFVDMKTALIAKNYDKVEFAEKMEYAIQFPEKMNKIGIAAKTLAEQKFSYMKYGLRILSFIYSI